MQCLVWSASTRRWCTGMAFGAWVRGFRAVSTDGQDYDCLTGGIDTCVSSLTPPVRCLSLQAVGLKGKPPLASHNCHQCSTFEMWHSSLRIYFGQLFCCCKFWPQILCWPCITCLYKYKNESGDVLVNLRLYRLLSVWFITTEALKPLQY